MRYAERPISTDGRTGRRSRRFTPLVSQQYSPIQYLSITEPPETHVDLLEYQGKQFFATYGIPVSGR